jgi:hypothetical protein
MMPPFDIFKTDKDGALLWCGAAETFEDAKEKASTFARSESREFVIFCQITGNRITIQPEG